MLHLTRHKSTTVCRFSWNLGRGGCFTCVPHTKDSREASFPSPQAPFVASLTSVEYQDIATYSGYIIFSMLHLKPPNPQIPKTIYHARSSQVIPRSKGQLCRSARHGLCYSVQVGDKPTKPRWLAGLPLPLMYVYDRSYVWHRLILLLLAWRAFHQCKNVWNTSWSSQDHSSQTSRKEALFGSSHWHRYHTRLMLSARELHCATKIVLQKNRPCQSKNPRLKAPTKASKNVTQPFLPVNLSPVTRHWASQAGPTEQRLRTRQSIRCGHPKSYRNPWHWLAATSLSKKPHIWQCRYFHLFLQVTGMIWNALSLADLGWSDLSSYHVSATRTQRCRSHQRKPSGARFNRFRGTNGIRLSFRWCFLVTQQNGEVAVLQWQTVGTVFRLGRCGSD